MAIPRSAQISGRTLARGPAGWVQIGIFKIEPRREWLHPHEARFLLRDADGSVRIDRHEEAQVLSSDGTTVRLLPFRDLLQTRINSSVLHPVANYLLAQIISGAVFFNEEDTMHLSHAQAVGWVGRQR